MRPEARAQRSGVNPRNPCVGIDTRRGPFYGFPMAFDPLTVFLPVSGHPDLGFVFRAHPFPVPRDPCVVSPVRGNPLSVWGDMIHAGPAISGPPIGAFIGRGRHHLPLAPGVYPDLTRWRGIGTPGVGMDPGRDLREQKKEKDKDGEDTHRPGGVLRGRLHRDIL